MKRLKPAIYILLLFVLQSVYSQNDCTDALVICGNSNFTDLSATGPGIDEISSLNSCGAQENNSLWLKINIHTAGTFGFTLTPQNPDLAVDFDFYVFGPNATCSNLNQSIRCSTTNPTDAGLSSNTTGMNASETDLSEGPGNLGNSFVKGLDVLDNETYFIVIDRPEGSSNFSLAWTGTATFNQPPEFSNIATATTLDLQKCDSDGIQDNQTIFDLTPNSALAIGSQTGTVATFHTSSNDVTTGQNPILNPNSFQNTSNPQIIFLRLTNSVSGCFSTTQFSLTVTSLQTPNPVNLYACDDNSGFAAFNLNDNNANLANGDPNMAVSYHLSATDNNNLPSNHSNPVPFTNETLWAKILETSTGCYVYKPFDLIIKSIPVALPAQLTQCDIELIPDGLSTFNLTQANIDLIGSNPNLSTKFYIDLLSAQNDTGALGLSFSNTTNPQILGVRIIDNLTGCYAVTTLTLNVNLSPTTTVSIAKCDIDAAEDGFFEFHLADAGFEILPNTVTYYTSSNDALLEQNAIPSIYINTIINQQTVYARIENNNACSGLNVINLVVQPLPEIKITDTQITCFNTPTTLNAGLLTGNSGTLQYLWSPGAETTPTINVQIPGDYSVRVTNNFGCSKDRIITLVGSDTAVIENIAITDLSDNNTVTIFVKGDENQFGYSIDFPNGPFQNSNYFENVAAGIHTVYIKDKDGCGIVPMEIAVVATPKFFTPNGDGFNDIWKITGLRAFSNYNSKLIIFDRYGKLIKQGSTNDGWDGTFNGKIMPADDYWYELYLEDGRIIKGNFSLKR